MPAVEALSSQVTQAQGFQEPQSFAPPESHIAQRHIDDLYEWHDGVFPDGESLNRQYTQYYQESGEVGEEVFGLDADQLEDLEPAKRYRVGAEVTDQIMAGLGVIRALGQDYESLRRKREQHFYDPTTVSDLERWQIDANGGNTPVKKRLGEYIKSSMRAQWLAEAIGAREKPANEMPSRRRKQLATRVAESITKGLSVLNGINESFDAHFDEASQIMRIKYNKTRMRQLKEQGLSDNEAMAEAKRIFNEKRFGVNHVGEDGSIEVFVAPQDEAVAA